MGYGWTSAGYCQLHRNCIVSFLGANKYLTTTTEFVHAATISGNGDAHVGSLFLRTMEKVGGRHVRSIIVRLN